MEKVTYTPAEFAEVFGKERTWGYRQLYAGKVKAITELGRTMIPKSEVDRLLGEAGRYLGAKAKTAKVEVTAKAKPEKSGAKSWKEAVRRQRKPSSLPASNAHSEGGRKSSSREHPRPCDPATSRKSVYRRLTQYKRSQKDGGDRDV